MRRGLLAKYAVPYTASNEGFGDVIRSLLGIRKNETKANPQAAKPKFSWLDWVATNLPNGMLTTKLKPISGPVVIPHEHSGYFQRGNRPFRNGFEQEYDGDINVLNVIYKKLKPVADKYLAAAGKQLDQISKLPMEVTPENAAKVNALLESFINKLPITPADAFESRWETADPAGWIGGYKMPMVGTDDSSKRAVFSLETFVPAPVSFEVSFPEASDIAYAVKMLNSLLKWSYDLWDLEDSWPHGDDPTDPPLRGFSQDITAKAWQGYDPLYVDNLSGQASELASMFDRRVERLIEGLVYYLIAATEPA